MMKAERNIADALYGKSFGAFTYRAFEILNPGQKLIRAAIRCRVLCHRADGARRKFTKTCAQPAAAYPEIPRCFNLPAGMDAGPESRCTDHLRKLLGRARSQILA